MPEVKIKVPPISHILFLERVLIKRAIKNNKIHIAQGFNPSKAPMVRVKTGKDILERSTSPKIGIFALGVGIWQIKTFIGYKGVCPVTEGSTKLGDRIRNGLKIRAEKMAISPFTLGILGGVILLALGVNLVEFFCSAGLPAIYTRILTLSQISTLSYYLYLLLYTFIFMLDDLIVFSLAVITLSRIGFTEKYNYWATLIGGLLIFVLGILLIFKPELLMFG